MTTRPRRSMTPLTIPGVSLQDSPSQSVKQNLGKVPVNRGESWECSIVRTAV